MLNLTNVTLVAATSVARAATLRAMRLSMEQVRFGAAVFLCDEPPEDGQATGIEWRAISPLRSRADYSRFMLHEMADHVATDFALVVQWDGYVLDSAGWRDEFLEYDYIGAPWPQFDDGRRVGNGGFSLRSSQLLRVCATLPDRWGEPEDISICRTFGHHLELEHGIRFAPVDIATRFAYEREARRGDEFGFHGVFNLIDQLPRKEFTTLIAGLEAGLVGSLECRDVLRKSLARGHWSSALAAFRLWKSQRQFGGSDLTKNCQNSN